MIRNIEAKAKRVAVQNLGCKVNRYESDAAIMQFMEAGYEIVDFEDNADIYIVNTCAVTAEAARKSRQQVNRAKRKNPEALVVATGCQAELDAEDLHCDLAIGNAGKGSILEYVERFMEDGVPADKVDIAGVREFTEFGSVSRQVETRAYLKVQDGCNNFCTYCTIPLARGRVRSRKEENVIAEAEELAKAGYREVVLTGIHVCSYGADRGEDSSALMRLALRLAEISGIERIRLSSLEPQSVTEEFVRLAGQNKKLCPHFHLSLQSGADEVLKRMNRRYDTQNVRTAVQRLREVFPDAGITGDVIVGFPGETDALFLETMKFCEEVGFSRLHVFRYSERPGTRAVSFSGKVSADVAKERSEQLIAFADRMQNLFYKSQLESRQNLLLETKTAEGDWTGYTPNYIPTVLSLPENYAGVAEEGEIVSVVLKDITDERMNAVIAPAL